MKLTARQRAVLVGTVLGDAFLQKTGKKNARIRLEHGDKQKEYLEWKMKQFPRLFQGSPKYLERKNPKSGKVYKYWRAQSNANLEIGKFRTMFYPEGKKKIPQNLSEFLNPLALTVWYMDDGYFYQKDKNSYLYLGRITKKEAEIAKQSLVEIFGLNPTIYDKKTKGFALFFGVSETKKFHKIIQPHMLSLFEYKLCTSFS